MIIKLTLTIKAVVVVKFMMYIVKRYHISVLNICCKLFET